MADALLVLLIGGSALGLAGVLVLLSRVRRRPRRKPAPGGSVSPVPPEPFLTRDYPPLLFAPGSSQLTSENRAALRAWAGELASPPGLSIVVVGSADTAGNPSRNRALARERAQAAARVLAAAGIPASRLDIQWREPQPGRTERDQAALRCVRIRAEPAFHGSGADIPS